MTEKKSQVWVGLALGLVGDKSASAGAGYASGSSDSGSSKGSKQAHGFFSIDGMEIKGYVGPILGVGNVVGVYGTAGVVFGPHEADFAVGGGIAFLRALGIGVLVPFRRAKQAAEALTHSDKALALADQAAQLYHRAGSTMQHSDLSAILSNVQHQIAVAPHMIADAYNTLGISAYHIMAQVASPQVIDAVVNSAHQAYVTLDKLI